MAKKSVPMNCFLVLFRTNLDDIPIALCATSIEARALCLEVAKQGHDSPLVRKARKVLKIDGAGPINMTVIRFVGGYPSRMKIVCDAAGENK